MLSIHIVYNKIFCIISVISKLIIYIIIIVSCSLIIFSTCQEEVGALVNRLGLASAKAQNLIEPVTDRAKFSQSEQLIYVLTEIEFSSKYVSTSEW